MAFNGQKFEAGVRYKTDEANEIREAAQQKPIASTHSASNKSASTKSASTNDDSPQQKASLFGTIAQETKSSMYDQKQEDVLFNTLKANTITREAVKLFGFISIIPFFLSALILWLYPSMISSSDFVAHILTICVYLGAILVSFLAGIRWGTSLLIEDTPEALRPKPYRSGGLRAHDTAIARKFSLSVSAMLVAWMAAMPNIFGFEISPMIKMTMITLAFAAQGWIDRNAGHIGILPGWYGLLRWKLTIYLMIIMVMILVRMMMF